MKAISTVALVLSCLMFHLAGGNDLYWQPNSNWNNPSNWALGKVPGCNDKASLNSVPAGSVIYLDTDATVQSLTLPTNGKLILGPSVTIRLSSEEDCTVPGDTEPMAAVVENEFIGASNKYWECASNWLTADNFPAEHAPCGKDRAFFDSGSSFSFVTANASMLFLSALNIRGVDILSKTNITSPEFNLQSIKIDKECATNPSLCPCPDDSMCPKSTSSVGGLKGPNIGGIVVGVVIGVILLIIVIIVLVVVAVVLYMRYRPVASYIKDDMLEEPQRDADSPPPVGAPDLEGDKKLYDNPLFQEDEIKVDLGSEASRPPLEDVPEVGGTVEMNVYVSNPPLYAEVGEKEKHVPKLNKYERF